MQVYPIKPTLYPTGNKRLKPKCDILLSTSAFNFSSHRYSKGFGGAARSGKGGLSAARRPASAPVQWITPLSPAGPGHALRRKLFRNQAAIASTAGACTRPLLSST